MDMAAIHTVSPFLFGQDSPTDELGLSPPEIWSLVAKRAMRPGPNRRTQTSAARPDEDES